MSAVPPGIVVLDVETTALDPGGGRLIDLGAVRLGPDLAVIDRLALLVDPGVPIPLAVTRLVGLRDEDVSGAASEAEALAALRAFAGDALLVAHNAAFDRAHLGAAAARAGAPPLANAWFDTLEAALLLFPELDSHALAVLAEQFDCRHQVHRALPDAETAADVFCRLCARAAGLGEQERRLLALAGWRPLATLDAFGVAPDASPPPPEELTGSGPREPDALSVAADGWRAELGADEGSRAALAGRLPGFRRREGQIRLAEAAAEHFAGGGIGAFEAGTGSGKSLAYLLPAAFASAAHGRRVVVSTRTKALQRQLAAHELPLVAQALPEGWRWALLMGRENYICRRRLEEAADAVGETLDAADRALALAYLVGRSRHGDVDLSALPYRAPLALPALAALTREVRSSRATCLGRFCSRRRTCLWRLARSRAEAAHLVCVNHALLLTGPAGLPAYEDVVIDEAHLLYEEATEAFSVRIEAADARRLLSDLAPRGQRPLGRRLRSLTRSVDPDAGRLLEAVADACEHAAADLPPLALAVGETLRELADAAQSNGTEAPSAYGDAAGGPYDRTVRLTAGLQELPAWDAFVTAAALLGEALAGLGRAAAAALEALPEDHREHAALAAVADEAGRLAALLEELPGPLPAGAVLWGELGAVSASVRGAADAARTVAWSLVRAPLTPGQQTRTALWDRLRSAVLVSATLTTGGSFAYFRRMTGLDADLDVREEVFPSPFDYRRQAVLVLERDPVAAEHRQGLAARQGERLRELAEVTRGRTLALFTNKREMQQVAQVIGAHLEADGVLVLAQGLHGSAGALADEFRAHPETVLMGVDTLWTGQDFPGEALICLVIAKLPFPRQDALFEARRHACEEAGERWFERFYLPEAVLRFRQGFGRLIRTETDTGVVVVLDPRLAQRGYRAAFLGSLPQMEVCEAAPDELAVVVGEHLRRLSRANHRPGPSS